MRPCGRRARTPSARSPGARARRSTSTSSGDGRRAQRLTHRVERDVHELARRVRLDADPGGLPRSPSPARSTAGSTSPRGERVVDAVRPLEDRLRAGRHRPRRAARRGCRACDASRGAAAWWRRRCARNASSPPALLPAMPSALTVVRGVAGRSAGPRPAAEEKTPATAWRAARARGSRAGAAARPGTRPRSRTPRPSSTSAPDAPTCWPTAKRRRQHDGGGVDQPAGVGVVEVERVHERAVGHRGGRRAEMNVASPRMRRLGRPAERRARPRSDGRGRAAAGRPTTVSPTPSSRWRAAACRASAGTSSAARPRPHAASVCAAAVASHAGSETSGAAPNAPAGASFVDGRRVVPEQLGRRRGRSPRCAAARGGTRAGSSTCAPARSCA